MPGGIFPGEKISSEGAKAIALVGGGLTQLTHLNLKSMFCFCCDFANAFVICSYGITLSSRFVTEFVPFARVIISENRIGGAGMMALAPTLGRCIHLAELNLECE